MFHVHLRRMYILLLGGVVYICLLGLVNLYLFKPSISLSILVLNVLSIVGSEVLKSPTISHYSWE